MIITTQPMPNYRKYNMLYNVLFNPITGYCCGVLRSDGITIPNDLNNKDWVEFIAWNKLQQIPLSLSPISPTAKKCRSLMSIYNDVNKLSANQKDLILKDLYNGVSPKILTSEGPNLSLITLLYIGYAESHIVSLDKGLLRLYSAAMYVQDNPSYLMRPAFDPTINISGEELI